MGCQYYEPTAGGASSFTVAMPRLTFGRGCLNELGARSARLGLKSVALMTDPHLLGSELITIAKTSLESAGISVTPYSDILIEPCDDTVADAAKFLGQGNFDGVISVGGGSVIDTAKGALAVAAHNRPIGDFFAPPIGKGIPIDGPLLPHIACPTTSGTGSESTSITVIRINEHNCKFVAASPYLLPNEALVDPACCDSLSPNIVASSGFDLLCHALECYTARPYTTHSLVADINARQYLQGSNPFSEMVAREALSLVGVYLERGVADKTDYEARDKLSWGATLAGIAFGNSGTHLPHAMSYGVTHLMDGVTTDGYPVAAPFVPHGISVAVSAPSIFRYTAEATPERHLDAAGYLDADRQGATPYDAGEILANRLTTLMRATNIPNGLSGVGFEASQIKALAASSFRQSRAIANAPRESNLVDLENMYQGALSYW